jgi:hypothetical protein
MGSLLIMSWMLSLGFVPNSSLAISGKSMNVSESLVQTLGVNFNLASFVSIYSSIEIRETKSADVYFDPFRGDYLLGGRLRYKNLSIGASHECNHDIVTNTDFHAYNGWEAAFEKAYINYAIPIHISPDIRVIPSITLGDQFTEKVRMKSNKKSQYFASTPIKVSPNIFFSEFEIALELFYLRARMAVQAGIATHNREQTHAQFALGAELFYKNISLGLEYIKRNNMQEQAGYALEALTLLVRFRGKASLL